MKNIYNYVGFALISISNLMAQQQRIIPCYTDEATKYLFSNSPEVKARYEKEMKDAHFTPEYQNLIGQRNSNGNNSVNSNNISYHLDTIPVVFHILHQGGPENVPDSYIYEALAEVNRVHTKKTPDSSAIDPYFLNVYGANNFVFQLATLDPNGNCTNGILRYYDANTNWVQPQYPFPYTWDRTKYLNVYIVKNICSQGSPSPCPDPSSNGIIVGYTYLPGTVSNASWDAVVYNYQFLTGTDARSLAHEFGHWLGLSHTFGSTNSPGTCMSNGQSDDFLNTNPPAVATTGVVDDTPKAAGFFSTCPPSTPNTCDASNYANVQNIMDYSSCPLNFTLGQIHRMHNMMGSTTANRNNVHSASNKVATGVRNPHPCVPVPYFHASSTVVCAGTTVTFSDSSSNATVTSWQWSFPGGTLANGYTLTDSMPRVIYNNVGTYAVSYTASTSAGGASITKSSYITVVNSVATYSADFLEGFESDPVPGSLWSVSNTGGLNWVVTSSTASSGLKSIMVNNFSNTLGDISTLTGPTYDLAAMVSPVLSFDLAYQQQATTNNDRLQIYASYDCGGTWSSKWSRSGTSLQPPSVSGQANFAFIPPPSQFTTYTVNLNSIASATNVMFQFVFYAGTSSTGNNIYLDNINIYNAADAGIENRGNVMDLSIYPNPTSGSVQVAFNLTEKHSLSVNITDMLGRVIETIPAQAYSAGASTLTLGSQTVYQAGVYMINIDIDGQRISKKIVVQ